MDPLNIAYYCSGHGLGHATRVIEVCSFLLLKGHKVTINTGAPHGFFQQQLPAEGLMLRKVLLDCGAFQLDAFTVDMKRSLEEYHLVAEADRETKLASEVAWLLEQQMDLVVSDVVPLGCAAASAAGVPSVCVSNFSWDFIYSEYLTSVGARFRKLVWQIAEDYAKADLLLRLPGYCPMPAFREVIDVPLVARKAQKTPAQVRAELGIPEATKLLVFMYGGQPPGDWELQADSLPPGWLCIVCSGGKLPGGKPLPYNFMLADKDAYTPDLIGAATCILGKIGYGSVSESLVHGKPFIFVRRDFFNEEPFLRKQLEIYGLAVEIKRRDFLQGNWHAFLQHASTLKSTYRLPTNGAEVVAELLEDLAHEKTLAAQLDNQLDNGAAIRRQNTLAMQRTTSKGSTRLRDAVVYGYIMQRHALQETVEVPEWYTRGLLPTPGSPENRLATAEPPPAAPAMQFDVLEGDPKVQDDCPDTVAFLALLADLARVPSPGDAAPAVLPEQRAARGLFRFDEPRDFSPQAGQADSSPIRVDAALPEQVAASSLFRFDDDLWVARAPGRLDVMGGIADYSGSLVLQMPLSQACHVAAQRHPAGVHLNLWRHIRDRHAASGGQTPVVRIVSLKADNTNRGHAFDMDLSELHRNGALLPYADARKYFQSDPSQSWAAYVAGALLVLMHEVGQTCDDGLSLLISSDVPDGKGVSSSAALEVAAMYAIAAAYGIRLEATQVAALCQKVENLVVGAPCGIMDQTASFLGQKDSLLALRCQPAQILPPVTIPAGLKFWGVDSGVRHSVGGQDYGSVRAAAFMGLKMVSSMAQAQAQQASRRLRNGNGVEEPPKEPTPIGNGYLANVAPSEFRQFFEESLPEAMEGARFLERFGRHWDGATQVQAGTSYPVAQATSHPINENFRVQCFRQALLQPQGDTPQLLGELMYQSHASYSRCGLGSEATDRLVALTRAESARAIADGHPPALFGAKITGGGSGGTVCILGRDDKEGEEALARVVAAYSKETGGFAPTVFNGSSMGAAAFGQLRIRLKSAGPEPTLSGIDI